MVSFKNENAAETYTVQGTGGSLKGEEREREREKERERERERGGGDETESA